MNQESVSIEFGHEILVRFHSLNRFYSLIAELRGSFSGAKGDILRQCHVLPRNPYNNNAVLQFCYSRFPPDRVFVTIALPVAA